MKNLQTLANELAADKMTLLVTNDMLNIRGGGGSNKKSKKKSRKRSNRGGGRCCYCCCRW